MDEDKRRARSLRPHQQWLSAIAHGTLPDGVIHPHFLAHRSISLSELSTHTTPGNAWIAIKGEVYDISAYLDFHPAGAKVLLNVAGTDATAVFLTIHPYVTVSTLLSSFRVGSLDIGSEVKGGTVWVDLLPHVRAFNGSNSSSSSSSTAQTQQKFLDEISPQARDAVNRGSLIVTASGAAWGINNHVNFSSGGGIAIIAERGRANDALAAFERAITGKILKSTTTNGPYVSIVIDARNNNNDSGTSTSSLGETYDIIKKAVALLLKFPTTSKTTVSIAVIVNDNNALSKFSGDDSTLISLIHIIDIPTQGFSAPLFTRLFSVGALPKPHAQLIVIVLPSACGKTWETSLDTALRNSYYLATQCLVADPE